jgi:4-amino-4-deoxy-L-arabinose transferase-like glycosyltransferase
LLTLTRYGYHRDELYFLACGKHLAWGFVDQPPLVPAIARLSDTLAPGSLAVLRLWPAWMEAATVAMAGVIAWELGAGPAGQIGATLVAACTPGFLLAGHLLSTATSDILVWALVTWLVLRLLRTGHPRWWVGVGVAIGAGLENKWTVGFLVMGLLVGMLATPQRRLLRSWWFALGIAVAVAIWIPNLVWQADHGWPQLTMIRQIQSGASGLGPTIAWFPFQILITGAGALLWLAGLLRVLRDPEARTYRPLGVAYVVLAVVLALAAGDKQYYVAGLYVPLYGAGAVPLERWLDRHRHGLSRPLAISALIATTALFLPLALPVLPVSAFASLGLNGVDPELGEQVGWPTLAVEVARAWDHVPPNERAHAVIITSNYGEAGAIERFGPQLGLPLPYSGHNSWWWWGRPPKGTTTAVLVGYALADIPTQFSEVRRTGIIGNPFGIEDQEYGRPILIATDPRQLLQRAWLHWRHYD